MSDITHNRIYTDNPDVIMAFLDDKNEVDFSRVIPFPGVLKGNLEEWMYDNWGTKCGDRAWSNEDYSLLRFDSPYRAPLGVYEEICRRFPDARITFCGSSETGGGCSIKYYENQNGTMKLSKREEILL